MEIKIILFFTVLLYSIIVSQSLAYIISLADVQKHMTATEYISFRKRTDKNFRAKFASVLYAALIINAVLMVVCILTDSFLLLTASIASIVFLSADTFVTLKYNMPINNRINQWTADNYPADWTVYRKQWLQAFSMRQLLNCTGFGCLVAGAVFYK